MVLSRIIAFKSKNIFTNLAAEERIFHRTTGASLLFYVNSTSAIIGRTQNAFKEVNLPEAIRTHTPIARRRSGGGTVVHDEGNLNMCFMTTRAAHKPCENARLMSSVLRDDFGIPAVISPRGDILVNGHKVSGSAYRLSRDRAYHHATLLVRSDLPRLRALLKSRLNAGINALGAASVPAPVTTLQDCVHGSIDLPSVMQAMADRWQKARQPKATKARIQEVSPASVEREVGGMQEERAAISNNAWIYGVTPRFSHSLVEGQSPVTLFMKKGAVFDHVEVPSDPTVQLRLQNLLAGVPFDGPSLLHALDASHVSDASPSAAILQNVKSALQHVPPQYWRHQPPTEEDS